MAAGPRCPQCGAALGAQVAPTGVEICEYCRTVVVRGEGAPQVVGRAVGPGADRIAGRQWVEALTCRLCGAPFPAEVARDPAKARCAYCGHRARVRPGLLAVLRVAATRPRTLPPRTRRGALAWVGAWILAIAVCAFAVVRVDRNVRNAVEIDVGPGSVERTFAVEIPTYVRHTTARIRPVAPESMDVLVDVTLRTEDGRVAWAQPARIGSKPYGRRWPLFGIRAGTYTGEATVSSEEPARVRVSFDTIASLGPGWIVLVLNVLVWSMFIDMGLSDFRRPSAVRRRVAFGLVGATLLLVACIGAFRWDPMKPFGAPVAGPRASADGP